MLYVVPNVIFDTLIFYIFTQFYDIMPILI